LGLPRSSRVSPRAATSRGESCLDDLASVDISSPDTKDLEIEASLGRGSGCFPRFAPGVLTIEEGVVQASDIRRRDPPALMRLSTTLVGVCWSLGLLAAEAPARRPTRFGDVPPALQDLLRDKGIDEHTFRNQLRAINQSTRERELAGENESLVYFALQSRTFTDRPPTEPDLAAQEFVQNLTPEERLRYLADPSFEPSIERLPKSAASRFHDLIGATRVRSPDERLSYFLSILRKRSEGSGAFAYLHSQYSRAMRFLYKKEFSALPQEVAAFTTALYEGKGHSTDTQIEANFPVYQALKALKTQTSSLRISSVLIVGPGLDLAPRTNLLDLFEPQSYQPFAVLDALLGLGLSDNARLQVHCVDINDQVVHYLRDFPKRKVKRLSIVSGVPDTDQRPFTDDYRAYFRDLGRHIGSELPLVGLPRSVASHLSKAVLIRDDIARDVTVQKLNIITERHDPSPQYDLVVVTNVFPYFNGTELALALANIEAMMRGGGYLIHNESRPAVFSVAKALGLSLTISRTVLIAPHGAAPLYDNVAVHRKPTNESLMEPESPGRDKVRGHRG